MLLKKISPVSDVMLKHWHDHCTGANRSQAIPMHKAVSDCVCLLQLLKILVSMGSISESKEKSKSSSQDGRKVSTVDPLSDDHMSADSDDDDEDDEESEAGEACEDGGEGGAGDTPTDEPSTDKSTQLLTEYVVNVVS